MTNKEKHTLIILEDELAHAEAIKRSLSGFGNNYNIIVAASLAEFERIISNTPDLVIADINLPDGSALTLLNEDIENQPWPIIVMTSHGDEKTAVTAIKSGALDYIVKSPEAFNNIDHVVKRNLREWRNIQKRKESEKKFRNLFETMAQGVIYQDACGLITAANPAAEKMLGFRYDETQDINTTHTNWRAIHEDGSVFPLDTYPATMALQSGEPANDVVMGVFHPEEKEYRWLLINAIPQFRNKETKPHQVFTTFTDITELKKAKETLQLKNRELKKAKEKAEESDKFKSAFIANISHEIRTPMSGILGFADLLKMPDNTGEIQATYIEAIIASGKRMLDIINDLINISRIEAGYVEIKPETTDINKLFDELYTFFLPEADKKEIALQINIELPPHKALIETDKTKLSQVMINLIKNALKFTTVGFIEFGCKMKDDACLFYVKDTGKGIKKEYQELIFERFEQGKIATSEIQEGVGLGLAISKAYVQLLGGKIWLESSLSEGTTFYFTVPYKGPVNLKNTPPKIKEVREFKISPIEVLIAEDEELIYFFLNEFLKLKNISTFHAKNGLEAVNAVKDNSNIKLILMDTRMPLMNGLEATRQIKSIRPEMPIIALSALANDTDIKEASLAGCVDYITKPIDTNMLLKKIAIHAIF